MQAHSSTNFSQEEKKTKTTPPPKYVTYKTQKDLSLDHSIFPKTGILYPSLLNPEREPISKKSEKALLITKPKTEKLFGGNIHQLFSNRVIRTSKSQEESLGKLPLMPIEALQTAALLQF